MFVALAGADRQQQHGEYQRTECIYEKGILEATASVSQTPQRQTQSA